MIQEQGSDLYLNVGSFPSLRLGDRILPMRSTPLAPAHLMSIVEQLLSPEKRKEFESTFELNIAFAWNNQARFRASFYRQQQQIGVVIRRIHTTIPSAASLGLPTPYTDMAMLKSGLVLVVGKAGAGKSTSLAAMIDYRNHHGSGHIITVEDPLEYIHTPDQCLFTQRDVGIDTLSFAAALRNALRQRPDVVLVGEIRDVDVMAQALSMAESGHLCFATLHASTATQAVERVLDFFSEERHRQVLKSLAGQLRGIFAQRLVDTISGGKALATEILLNEGAVTSLILERKMGEVRELIAKSNLRGMHSFDQSLFALVCAGTIREEVALSEAESANDLSLLIRQWRIDHPEAALPQPIAGKVRTASSGKRGYIDLDNLGGL
jgi:twitching motility protein PilU